MSTSPSTLGHSILALLLDYDGTLSPAPPHPDLATIPRGDEKVLERLANMPDVFVGVISGRSVNNAGDTVGIEGIITPATTDSRSSSQTAQVYAPDAVVAGGRWRSCCRAAGRVLQGRSLGREQGVLLTYHFRNVPTDKGAHRGASTPAHYRRRVQDRVAHCVLESKPR